MNIGPSDPSAVARARIGETLNGKWRLDRLIDVGGMGAVYEATHRNGRRAALKLLHTQYAANVEVRQRFLREGYVANKIDHPGAVAILDDDVSEDQCPFLVMELLEGESLSAMLTRLGGRLRVPEALGIAGQVLEVLEAAHENGVVHRDIKPGNVFITRTGHTKLLDFGLARVRGGGTSHTPTAVGIVMGTAGYLSPEQARGQPDQVDARSDLFAVGAVLYRAVSGVRIHEGDNALEMTFAAMQTPAPSFATVFPEATASLVHAVDRALAFEKEARWPSARLMREALRTAYQDELRVRPHPAGPPAQPAVKDREETLDDLPSLAVEIAFGEEHDQVVESERQRIREVIEGLSGISVAIEPDALRGPREK